MHIDKDSIQSGKSFVLRSSLLSDALQSAEISIDTHVRLINSATLFEAFYWPPNPNVKHERFYVRAGVVSSLQAKEVRLFMVSSVLPRFVLWAKGILESPHNSPIRVSEQRFAAEFPGKQA